MVKFKRLFSGLLALSVAMSIFMLGTLTAAALSWDGSKITFEADTETLTDPWGDGTITRVDGFGGKEAGDKCLKITGEFTNENYSHGFMLAQNETLAASKDYYVDFMFFATGKYDAIRVELSNKDASGNERSSTGDKFLSFSADGTLTYLLKDKVETTATTTWEPGKWHRLTLRYAVQADKKTYMYAYLDGNQVINKGKPFGTATVNIINYLRIAVKDENLADGETPALYLDNLRYCSSLPTKVTSVDYTINRNGGIYSDGSNLYTTIGTSVDSILKAIDVTDGIAVVCGSDLIAKESDDLFAEGDKVVLSDNDGTLYQTLDISSNSIVAGQNFDDQTGEVPGINYASTTAGNPTISYESEAIYGKSSTGYALVNTYENITTTTTGAVSGYLNICEADSGAPLWAKNGTANILPEALTYEYTFLAEGDYDYVYLAGRWDFYDTSENAEVANRRQQFLKIFGDGSVVYGNAENPEPGIKILPGEWVNVQLTVRPQLNTYSVVVNGYILVGSAEITEHMDANEDIPRGFGWFGPGIAFAENVSDESAAFYLGDWSVKIGEYVTDGYEASVNYPDVSSDNKIIYIPDSVAKSDFITACAIPENATMKIYTDRTLNTEVASTARVNGGNVAVVTSENGSSIAYFDIKIGGLGLEDIKLKNNGDGTYTASVCAWYTLKEDETTQPPGLLIIAVYNQDGSMARMSADSQAIADGDGTEFSATAKVEENQTVKAMLWDSYASLIPYTAVKTE